MPSTYLIFGFGDRPLVTGKHVEELSTPSWSSASARKDRPRRKSRRGGAASRACRCTACRRPTAGWSRSCCCLPVAALIICVFRNVIGLNSFGTFAPALIGLAFHDLHSMPGIFVFVAILLVGWLMRRLLDHYHLLQVPRVATMLTLIMSVLIGLIVLSNLYGATATRYISLFPDGDPDGHGRALLDAGDGGQHGGVVPHAVADDVHRHGDRAGAEPARSSSSICSASPRRWG